MYFSVGCNFLLVLRKFKWCQNSESAICFSFGHSQTDINIIVFFCKEISWVEYYLVLEALLGINTKWPLKTCKIPNNFVW